MNNSRRKEIDYCSFFNNSLLASLLLLEKDIPKSESINIQFLYVYPTNEHLILDSDNHDTKSVTDAITSFILCGDSPCFCSYSYLTTRSDAIPKGTYITVSSGFGKSPNYNDILSKWKDFLCIK